MKNILLISLFILGLAACSDDDVTFEASVPRENITFIPIDGGAVMHYRLPQPTDIYAVCARYTDAQGKEMVISSTAFLDTMQLLGFNEARQNVPVKISFLDKNNVESAPLEMTFNTLVSVPYAFLDCVEVVAAWDGVRLNYSFAGEGTGLANVFYIGVNPYTQKTDTLFVDNLLIARGTNSIHFKVNSGEELNTIVVRTEDFRGYNVRTKVWENLGNYPTRQLPTSDFTLEDPENWSTEREDLAVGLKYLTDGDTKGIVRLENNGVDKYYTYVTHSYGLGSYVLVDMQQPQVPASIRLYGQILTDNLYWYDMFYNNYNDRLPCAVKVYGSNDKTNWVLLGQLNQKPDGTGDCWASLIYQGPITTVDQLNVAEPYYCEIVCELGETEYRYLKVESNEVFNTNSFFPNDGEYVSYQELEVYVKKD